MKKTAIDKHFLFITGFWILLTFTLIAQISRDYPTAYVIFPCLLIIGCAMLISYVFSNKILPNAFTKGKTPLFAMQSFSAIVLLTFVIATVNYMTFLKYGANYTPSDLSLIKSQNSFWFLFFTSSPAALLILGSVCGFKFYQRHNQIELQHNLLKQAHAEAHVRILQDQINPHLMFNVLNHIHILMKKDVDLASVLLVRFSDILRYQIYECNMETVSLEKDVKYLKDLVSVEKIRWGEELEVKCDWNIANGKRDIVPLLLVPFVENAFKHVSRLPASKGYVHLQLNQDGEHLTLKIENSNSVQPSRKNSSNSGLGLENVRQRLKILYPDHHELDIQNTSTLFSVVLNINLEKKANYAGN
ncbi:GHKL domain-containing protein [Pedobacter steynii]|uniref:GHKL domain-containing protein n=1 Tax=Pedobacter steynii TaxID=430522 RepID=A0A1G9IQR4_9SPHI|nr:histidine kinase [Pedobacter steynii]NQX38022.1 histidine kinase [Pedobacter steynii]SDL27639.1 GHKL domain-containing protein [Pedobacter steynii]